MSGKSFGSTDVFGLGNDHDNAGSLSINPDRSENMLQSSDLDGGLRRKIDLRLYSIAGTLCLLDLLDSGVISSASVGVISVWKAPDTSLQCSYSPLRVLFSTYPLQLLFALLVHGYFWPALLSALV